MTATLDLNGLIQEALIHVTKENAGPPSDAKITYEDIPARAGVEVAVARVRLDGHPVGFIRACPDGYFYVQSGGKRGEIFPTLDAVKKSLEG